MTREQFISGFLPLAKYFNDQRGEGVIDIYYNALKKYDFAAFQNACAHIAAEREFMPKIVDFLEILDPKPSKEELEARAVIAWNAANEARARAGQYRSVKFDDERIHQVIRANYGDWVRFCLFEQPHGANAEKRAFCETYLNTKERGGEYSRLKGLTELDGYFDGEVERVAFIVTRGLSAGENCRIAYRPVALVLQIEAQKREALESKNPVFGMVAKIDFTGERL